LPGVGQNLQDHLIAPMQFKDPPQTSYRQVFTLIVSGLARYAATKTDPLTGSGAEALAVFDSAKDADAERKGPNFQVHFMPASMEPPFTAEVTYVETKARTLLRRPFYMTTLIATLLHPYSRGSLALASSDPFEQPVIQPAYLSDRRDLRVLVEGLRSIRRISAEMRKIAPRLFGDEVLDESLVREIARLRDWDVEDVALGGRKRIEAADSDAYLEEYVRRVTMTLYHPGISFQWSFAN
ncbi:hypothetical protein HK405_005207, partial [Cladochytrium tenue]